MQLRLTSPRASRYCWYGFVLVCCVAANAVAESKPLPTQYVECVRDDKGVDIASQSMPTPIFNSMQGFKAYGVVAATYSPEGACTNTTTVYVAEPAGTFRVALQQQSERLQDGSVYDGNGIERIEWSPTGTRLLVEISQWTWGTDGGGSTKYILLTPATGEITELPIAAAIQKHFAKACVRLVSSSGWLDDERIGIELKPDKDVDEEGKAGPTPSCVAEPTLFSFDVDFGDFLNWRYIAISLTDHDFRRVL